MYGVRNADSERTESLTRPLLTLQYPETIIPNFSVALQSEEVQYMGYLSYDTSLYYTV